MMKNISNRYDFVFLFDVENGNPNGDPDSGNLPRIDPETMHGIVSDVCIKRKIRNYIELVKEDKSPYCIYVKEKAVLTDQQQRAYKGLSLSGSHKPTEKEAQKWMCENFFDVRTFGAVMSLKEAPCGQVRGPVQLNFSRSIDPVLPLEMTITRIAVATAQESKTQNKTNLSMGRKSYIPYGLFRLEGYISANLAAKTGFSEKDLGLFWEALENLFEHDHSAARGKMTARKLFVFKHNSPLGNAPSHKLFETIKITRAAEHFAPPRSFEDYKVLPCFDDIPNGVILVEYI